MLAKEEGSVKLSDAIDTLPSLLPNGTDQYGPLILKKETCIPFYK